MGYAVTVEEVKDRVDIVAVAEALGGKPKKRGGEYRCACFIHGGNGPNLSINRDKGVFDCKTSCGGGDVVAMVQKAQNIDFKRALRWLCDFAGISWPEPSLRSQVRQDARPVVPKRSAPDAPFGLSLPQLETLWSGGHRTASFGDVTAALSLRGLSAARVDALDLARAHMPGTYAPKWYRGGDWRLLLPMYAPGHRDPTALGGGCRVVSMRTRWIGSHPPRNGLKSPTQRGSTTRGCLMANVLGQLVLLGRVKAPIDVVIVEGEIDYLTWATRVGDDVHDPFEGHEPAAVFGILAGSWTQEIADLIPKGSRVAIRTDDDAAGSKYAAQVAQTVMARCEVVA